MKDILYIVCFAFLLWGCTTENDWEINENAPASIVLKLKPDDSSIVSRATESGNDGLNENKIENIYVFFFPQNASDNQTCVKYESISGLSFQGTGTFSKELTTSKNFFSAGVTYDIYTIANLPSNITIPTTITLGALKALRTVTPLPASSTQNNFVMDGKVSAIVNPTIFTPAINIDMPLKRAASKVRVQFVLSPSTDVHTATVAQVSLKHFGKYSSLLDGFPATLATGDYDNTSYITGAASGTFTFYCYENNWGTTTANETYLNVNLPFGTTTANYYRIPINKYANNIETGRIDRNMIYDVVAYIDKKGGDDESGAVSINSNCLITDWTNKSIILKTINQHYLGISEYNIIMPNISSYTLNYMSDLPISITNIASNCLQYNSNGSTTTITYTSGQSQFPTFTINTTNKTITINSTIPINYVPKNITFTVTNNQGLSLSVTVIQYPVRYVTAQLSNGNIKPEWFTGGTNLNLYTVNTLVPSTDGSYILGDPTNGYAKTDSTAIGNKMVSPRFIIASQYGIYNRVTYPIAQLRCFMYGEDIYRSGWRMPTKAEIELINRIQDDTNSAVKGLLTGDAYWSAFKYDYYDFVNNTWTNETSTGTAYIRAVYDLYKYEQ